MVLDGASTVGVVEDELLCENVRPANITLKVGGQGKPNFVQCKKVGELRAHQLVDGRATEFNIIYNSENCTWLRLLNSP